MKLRVTLCASMVMGILAGCAPTMVKQTKHPGAGSPPVEEGQHVDNPRQPASEVKRASCGLNETVIVNKPFEQVMEELPSKLRKINYILEPSQPKGDTLTTGWKLFAQKLERVPNFYYCMLTIRLSRKRSSTAIDVVPKIELQSPDSGSVNGKEKQKPYDYDKDPRAFDQGVVEKELSLIAETIRK